jgi:hypothetical protein
MVPEIAKLLSIPVELRCNFLVGTYLTYFAHMEYALDDALSSMLGLDRLRGLIVTKTTPFAAKVSMFRTLGTISPKEEVLAKLAKALSKANNDRKILAHSPFGPSPSSDGVAFVVILARDKFDFPDIDWSVADFHAKISRLEEIRAELAGHSSKHAYSAVAAALLKGTAPSLESGSFLERLMAMGTPDSEDSK